MTHDPRLIISLTPGLSDAVTRARQLVRQTGAAVGVWEHVGVYGSPTGDIPAQHTFKTQAVTRPDPSAVWALVALIDPADAVL